VSSLYIALCGLQGVNSVAVQTSQSAHVSPSALVSKEHDKLVGSSSLQNLGNSGEKWDTSIGSCVYHPFLSRASVRDHKPYSYDYSALTAQKGKKAAQHRGEHPIRRGGKCGHRYAALFSPHL
jgi:hypothetical protein